MCLAATGWAAVLVLGGCGTEEPAGVAGPEASVARAPAADASEPAPPVERDWPADELRTGGTVEAELDRDEAHLYRLPLDGGQYLRVRVEQVGVDPALFLQDPEGRQLLKADRMINEFGPELILAVAEEPGTYSLGIRNGSSRGPGRYQARIEELRPASEEDRRAALAYQRFWEAHYSFAGKDRERAVTAWTDALATWRELGEAALEAEVLERIARDHYLAGEWDLATTRYRQALALFQAAGEVRWELMVRQHLAVLSIYRVEYDAAIDHYGAAAELARETGDLRVLGAVLYGLGSAYKAQGQLQAALSHLEEALEYLAEDDPHTRPLALHTLGTLHRLHFQNPRRARELLVAARDLYRPEEIPTHPAWKARALKDLGLLAYDQGQLAEAREQLQAALEIETGFDVCGRATALGSLALLDEEAGARRAADVRMTEAFDTLDGHSCGASEVTLNLLAAARAERRGDPTAALAAYAYSRELAARQGDRTRLAEALSGTARSQRALGRKREAVEASGGALAILEEVRPTVLREDLRTAYFSTAQQYFDLHIGLLVDLGEEEEAWAVAERARAQALRDLLAESGTGLRRSADPGLVERERVLQRRLNVLEGKRSSSIREPGPEALDGLRREIDALIADLERVRGDIRSQSPTYAALTAPRELTVRDLQRDVLDSDTILLEYRLGEEGSWLWAITRDSFDAFALPPREEVEAVSREAARWTHSLRWPGQNPPPLCELGRLVLGPVAGELAGQRLVVVADGALEEVSFAALPSPDAPETCAEAAPLVATNEIVHLPSASALAAQRRLLAGRRPADGWLAMVADPVYGPDDRRLGRPPAGPRPAALTRAPTTPFERLPRSGEEADAVLRRLPRAKVSIARGLDASKQAVTGGSLSGHRIVHFATHGVLDPEQPLLSYLALSQVSADGTPIDGSVYAHEIYDLELPAELVVLSACDTGRGRQVRGEGLVSGLPRAFLYAGAARVLVSLWPVQDRSTRDLMDLFYRGLIEQGLPPGRALQEAQRSLWESGRPPYQWAGFVLEGDWRPLPPF